MTTHKTQNNSLIIIVAIAVILFVAAFIWKSNSQSNEEKITAIENPIKVTKNKVKKVRPKVTSSQQNTNNDNSTDDSDDNKFVTMEDRAKLMGWSYKYTTIERTLEGIEYYESIGDTKAVNKLYDILEGLEKYEASKKEIPENK
jgi:mannitol-specific phosphotransferase system IIBC component